MTFPRPHRRWLCWCALLLAAGSASAATRLPPKVVGIGGDIPKTGNTYDIAASLGTRVGGNLFHTFVQFDLSSGEIATFGGPAGISNILARVTGSRSYIDGKIQSTVPDANLYLINANGITFGKHAQLDVPASFTATTADVIKLADGGKFDAIDPTKDSLTAGPISAYGFLGKNNSIEVAYNQFPRAAADPGTTLSVKAGQTLSLIGGPVSLTGGDTDPSAVTLNAPQGRLELASVKKGDLKADFSSHPQLDAMSLSNVSLNSEGLGSRGIALRAGTATLSQVKGTTSGNFDTQVTGTAVLDHGTLLYTKADGSQPAGNFSIRGGVVKLRSASEFGSVAVENATAGTKAGKVTVRAGRLSLSNGSKVQSNTNGPGAAGSVDVQATQIGIASGATQLPAGIFSESLDLDPAHHFGLATGAAGNVRVRADTLTITSGGAISADTLGLGAAGNVTVQARDILLAQANEKTNTGIFSDSFFAGAGGNGGDVRVSADRLEIRDGALISTKTLGAGRGGSVFVDARELDIDLGNSPLVSNNVTVVSGDGHIGPTPIGVLSPKFTGLASDSATNASPSAPAQFAGAGGDVYVRADEVHISNGGQISASTATQGKGGVVDVEARNIVLEGHHGDLVSSISADTRAEAGLGGAGGGVNVTAAQLVLKDGGRISATTFGAGQAGEVHVNAGDAQIVASPGSPFTGILAVSASPTLAGAGGNVRAEFGTLTMNGGGIAGNTQGPGRGGSVVVDARSAQLSAGGQISADTSGLGAGGSVLFTTGDLLITGLGAGSKSRTGVFSSSSATGLGGRAGTVEVNATTAQLLDGGTIAATSSSSGEGGSVVVNADTLSLDRGSTIQASSTGLGSAGSVAIQVTNPFELLGASSVSSTSAISTAGTVAITSASDIIMEGGSSVTVQALLGNAGQISLITKHMLLMRDSRLIAEAGMNGGNIFVDPQYIILDHSIISANAAMTGGNILLVADEFLPSETSVTATGSTAGTVQISAPALDLSGALAALNAQLVDASIRFQERCAMRLGGDVSTFLVLGRGGVEDFPGETPLVISRRLAPEPPGAGPLRKK